MKIYPFVIFILLSKIVFSQDISTIQFHDIEVKVDGQLDESIWKQLPEYTNFHNFYPVDSGLAEKQTHLKVFHNGTYLYIGAVYEDAIAENRIGSLKRDDHFNTVVSSDAFGVILDAYNKQNNGYYFCVNAEGAQLESLIELTNNAYDLNTSWNAIWYAETAVKGTQKIYELAIPFKALNFNAANAVWGINFFNRDIKQNIWTTFSDMPRNFLQYDLRYTQDFQIEELPQKTTSRITLTPAATVNYQDNVAEKSSDTRIKPSLDVQYNLTSSLKLDATINPDFSQIDVDQQVTNLTRFAVNFPERRNFFLENSDLFNNLGTAGVNPFYSRRIGAETDMLFGIKLSGNIAPNTRIGILNAQTEKEDDINAQNYAVLLGQQKLTDLFTASLFLVNRQEMDDLNPGNDYNRVTGGNVNYTSKNNKWTGLINYAKSFTSDTDAPSNLNDNNDFFNIETRYSDRKKYFKGAFTRVAENYITDLGFVPRLYNYDPENDEIVREAYWDSFAEFYLRSYPKKLKKIDNIRYLYLKNDAFWDVNGTLTESTSHFGNTLWLKKNLAALYLYAHHDYYNLKYGFDILQNGNSIAANEYHALYLRGGFNNIVSGNKFYYQIEGRYGGYYGGKLLAGETYLGYRLLPFAQMNVYYEQNHIDLYELGKETFHLLRFTGEVFFSNKLNWTTYIQYNTQFDNFNINSRLQWEYRPLSFVYLVITDNFNKEIDRQNWGIALKVNYRLEL